MGFVFACMGVPMARAKPETSRVRRSLVFKNRQLRIRPHNDDSKLCVIELAKYDGDASAAMLYNDVIEDSVVTWEDAPHEIMRLWNGLHS